MLRSIRRFLALVIAFALAAPSSAEAGFLTYSLSTLSRLSGSVLTSNTCGAVTPVVHAMSVSVPSAGAGNSCTNDTQCAGLDEACVFNPGTTVGFCSASGILSRDDIHYVAGTQVDVEVTIPECTAVSHVNGVPLGGYSGIDAQAAPVSWVFLANGPATTVNGQPAIRQRVRVTVPNAADGTTGGLTIQVTARTGGATTTRSTTLVQVAAVNAAMRSTVAEQRLRNSFVTSIYRKFGDYEQFYNEDGDRAYGINWSELVTFPNGRFGGTDMRIQDGRVAFSLQFKADAPGCDPDVYVDGLFRLVPAGDSVQLQWIREPDADADASGWCAPLSFGIWDVVVDAKTDEQAIAEPVAESVSFGFGADAEGRIKVCDLCRVVDVKVGGGKIDIWTLPPTHRVRIKVRTARGTDPTASPASLGMMIPAGFVAPIAGGGSFDTCVYPDAVPGSCDGFVADMDGAFNWWGSDVPVPDSIAYTEYGTAFVLGGRANARARLKGVLRDVTTLPSRHFPADSLIARRTDLSVYAPSSRVRVENGCVVPASSTPYRIAIGVNERPWAPPLRGTLEATVLLADNKDASVTLFGNQAPCQAEPSPPPIFSTSTSTSLLSR